MATTITNFKVIENNPVAEIVSTLDRIAAKVRVYTVVNLIAFVVVITISGMITSLVGTPEGLASFSILGSLGWLALSFTRRYVSNAKILEKEFEDISSRVEKYYSQYPEYEQNQIMLRFLIEFKRGVAAYKL